MKRLVFVTLVAIVVGAGPAGSVHVQAGSSPPRYQLARVERGPLTAVVTANGALSAVTTVQVGSQISGQVKALLADFNSAVRKGAGLRPPNGFPAGAGHPAGTPMASCSWFGLCGIKPNT